MRAENPSVGLCQHKRRYTDGIRKSLRANEAVILASVLYLIISLAMFWPASINFRSTVVNGTGDVLQTLWALWFVPYSTFVLGHSPYHTNLVYYPVGANLVADALSPLAGILFAPFQSISLQAEYNIIFFLGFALSGVFAFLLAEHITKNRYASFLGGLIYAFSPFHIAHAYTGLDWTTIEFIPLFVLFFLLMIESGKKKYAAFAALSFVLLTFMGDIEQGIIAASFMIISVVALSCLRPSSMLNKKTAMNLALLVVSILLIGSPFFIFVFQNLPSSFALANQNADINHNLAFSDSLLSFLLPSPYNGLFKWLSSGYSGMYPAVSEDVSYIGYSILFLSAYAVYRKYKEGKIRDIAHWLVVGVIAFLLALGPYLAIPSTGNAVHVTSIPMPFLFYRRIPAFNVIREPGRFDVILTITLSVLASIGFSSLMEKKRCARRQMAYAALFSLLILIEYNGMLLSSSAEKLLFMSPSVPSVYNQIGALGGNFSVLVLPPLDTTYAATAMYYQTAMKKPLIGGYISRWNFTQFLSVENIPLAASSTYLLEGKGLSYVYPIEENYTNLTLAMLRTYNVSYVSVIDSAYNYSQKQVLLAYLNGILGDPVYQYQNATVYDTVNAIYDSRKSVSAYLSFGNWTPGYYNCKSPQQCNQVLASLWWGDQNRGIEFASPNDTDIEISMLTASYYPNQALYVYLNGKQVSQIELQDTLANYSISTRLSKGNNDLRFCAVKLCGQENPQQDIFYTFGLSNITFSTK